MKLILTKAEAAKIVSDVFMREHGFAVDVVIKDTTVESVVKTEGTPWYPDDGNWVEIEPSCNLPIGLKKHTNVEVLLCSERANRDYLKRSLPAYDYDWEDVVAYKVVE